MRAGGLGSPFRLFLTCLLPTPRTPVSQVIAASIIIPAAPLSKQGTIHAVFLAAVFTQSQDICLLYFKRLAKQCLFPEGLPLNRLLVLKGFMLQSLSGGLCHVYPPQGCRGDISLFIHIHPILAIWKCLSSISKVVASFDIKVFIKRCYILVIFFLKIVGVTRVQDADPARMACDKSGRISGRSFLWVANSPPDV